MLKTLYIAFAVLFLAACSTNYSSSKQVADQAFLMLTGEFDGAVLVVDKQAPVALDSSQISRYKEQGKEVIKFEISVGEHEVSITKNGQLVVHRKIFVSNGNSLEVIIP